MRVAFLFPLALLAACGSQKPADDTLGTLDGDGAAQQGTVSASAGGATPAPVTGGQAVDAEGAKLEPLLSSAISEAGLVSGSCRFSPSKGALPVLVASLAGGKGIISVGGRQVDVAATTTVAPSGGSFAGDGVTLTVSASDTPTLGRAATMQVTDADGPAFTYRDGFWLCN
ncbi:hypothetical protein [Blastomonas sp.]|uniref:hypothetical protein n=1 Tax=Blastomonas sp. TaxID=1909299 RepID=UPI002615D829|nr:hypothetical protein [Blastomonas sp.]MDM7956677.1 hypothetical protein [Blastomonas sp.]